MRLFIGIKPDIETVMHLNKKAKEANTLFEKARLVQWENYHITLVFIGQSDGQTYLKASKVIKEVAGRAEEFKININGTGQFKKRDKALYYFSIESNPILEKIQKNLLTGLFEQNILKNKNKFHAHITFARDVVTNSDLNNKVSVDASFKAKEILLMESIRVNKKLVYSPRYSATLKGK